jgi:hypothetical protein
VARDPAEPASSAVIACSLSARDAAEREQWLARLIAHATSVATSGSGATVTFAADPALERELRALANAEAECCPFLAITVRGDSDRLVMTLDGPPDARSLILEMVGLADER